MIRYIINILRWVNDNKKKSGKSFLWIIFDFYRLNKKNKVSKIEYSNYKLYSASKIFIESFLPYAKAEEYWMVLNPRKYAVLARDKFVGHAFLSKIGVATAQLYFVYDRETSGTKDNLVLNTKEQVIDKIKQLDIKQFVAKPAADSAHGKGVGVYYVDEIVEFGGVETTMDEILSCGKAVLFESLIKQTNQMSILNKTSVNTIRVMTALYPNQEVRIIAAFIKIGRLGSCVDNAGSGGNVDCAVNVETGELYNAIQFNSWEEIFQIEKHPDTGVQLNGIVINDWNNIKVTLMNWQSQIPYIKVIGWDVAITDNGPIIVEFNNWWDTTGQLFLGKGWHKEIKDCYDAWVNYYKKNS